MASYVYVKNPNGTTYVYENESYWDKTEQKTKHHRKCVGKLHPEFLSLHIRTVWQIPSDSLDSLYFQGLSWIKILISDFG